MKPERQWILNQWKTIMIKVEPERLTYPDLYCYKSLLSFHYLGAKSVADARDFHCIISKKLKFK